MKVKTCIVGNSQVGKTSIILRLFQNTFKQGTMPTIGVDYKVKKQKINGQQCAVQLWDTTGQDKFRSVMANFFRQAQGVFVVFDMTNDKSVVQVEFWLKQLDKFLDNEVPKILLGNKSDLKQSLSQTAQEKVKYYCQQYNMSFFKVSAKKTTNIKQAFGSLTEQAYKYAKKNQRKKNKDSIYLQNQSNITDPKKGCC